MLAAGAQAMLASTEAAFPTLTTQEMDFIRSHATRQTCRDGEVVFKAGQAGIDFFVVESGELEIINPTADNASVTVHAAGHFAGDIDMLTRRPLPLRGAIFPSSPGPGNRRG